MKYNQFTFKDDKLLCWRLGPINPQKQAHYNKNVPSIAGAGTHKPPVSRGMWAFPYPHYDYFFCYHQWKKHLPKRLIEPKDEAEWEEQESAMKVIMKRYRPSTFYASSFYSHIFPNGSTDYSEWHYWDDIRKWGKVAGKTIYQTMKIEGIVQRWKYTVDHLELFIP
jgi:hypothetical protein